MDPYLRAVIRSHLDMTIPNQTGVAALIAKQYEAAASAAGTSVNAMTPEQIAGVRSQWIDANQFGLGGGKKMQVGWAQDALARSFNAPIAALAGGIISKSGAEFQDVFNQGVLGVSEAVRTFDYRGGNHNFNTYAITQAHASIAGLRNEAASFNRAQGYGIALEQETGQSIPEVPSRYVPEERLNQARAFLQSYTQVEYAKSGDFNRMLEIPIQAKHIPRELMDVFGRRVPSTTGELATWITQSSSNIPPTGGRDPYIGDAGITNDVAFTRLMDEAPNKLTAHATGSRWKVVGGRAMFHHARTSLSPTSGRPELNPNARRMNFFNMRDPDAGRIWSKPDWMQGGYFYGGVTEEVRSALPQIDTGNVASVGTALNIATAIQLGSTGDVKRNAPRFLNTLDPVTREAYSDDYSAGRSRNEEMFVSKRQPRRMADSEYANAPPNFIPGEYETAPPSAQPAIQRDPEPPPAFAPGDHEPKPKPSGGRSYKPRAREQAPSDVDFSSVSHVREPDGRTWEFRGWRKGEMILHSPVDDGKTYKSPSAMSEYLIRGSDQWQSFTPHETRASTTSSGSAPPNQPPSGTPPSTPPGSPPAGNGGDPPQDPPPPTAPADPGPDPGDRYDRYRAHADRVSDEWSQRQYNRTYERAARRSDPQKYVDLMKLKDQYQMREHTRYGIPLQSPMDREINGDLVDGVQWANQGMGTISRATSKEGFQLARSAWSAAIAGPLPEEAKEMYATINKRVNDYISNYVKRVFDTAKTLTGDERLAAENTARQTQYLAKQHARRASAQLAGDLDPNMTWSDRADNTFTGVPKRTAAEIAELAQQRPEIGARLARMGLSPAQAASGQSFLMADDMGGMYEIGGYGGGGYGRRGGGGRGIFSGGFGSAMYGLYLAKRFYGYTAGPVVQGAHEWSDLIGKTGMTGMDSMIGTDAALSASTSQASLAQQRAAYNVLGAPLTAWNQMMSNPLVAEATAVGKLTLGIGVGGAMAGGTLGAMGLLGEGVGMAGGAAAFGVPSLVAGAALANTYAAARGTMSGINNAGNLLFGGKYPAMQSIWDMPRRTILAIDQGIALGGYYTSKALGIDGAEDRLRRDSASLEPRMSAEHNRLESQRMVDLSANIAQTYGLAADAFMDPLAKFQAVSGLSVLSNERTAEVATELIQQAMTEGKDPSGYITTAAQYAETRGYLPGTGGFEIVMASWNDMTDAQRAVASSRAQRTQGFAAQLSQYGGGTTRANIFRINQAGITTQSEMNPILTLLGGASQFGSLSGADFDTVFNMGAGMDVVSAQAAVNYAAPLMLQGASAVEALQQFAALGMSPDQNAAFSSVSDAYTAYGWNQDEVAGAFNGNRRFNARALAFGGKIGGALAQYGYSPVAASSLMRRVDDLTPQQQMMFERTFQGVAAAGGSLGDYMVQLGQTNFTNQQATNYVAAANGDFRAASYMSYDGTGSIANRIYNQAGSPVYRTDMLSFMNMMRAQADAGNPYAQQGMQGILPWGSSIAGPGYQQVMDFLGTGDQEAAQAWIDGGAVGRTQLHNQRMFNFSMAGIGVGLQQIALRREFLYGSGTWDNPAPGSMYAMQDEMRAMQTSSTLAGFAYQEQRSILTNQQAIARENLQGQRMGLSQSYQLRSMNFNYQTQLMQRDWTRQDWQYQDQMNALSYGWQMEDLEEAIRTSSGRQRKALVRQRDRATTQYNLEGQQTDRVRDRQQELWDREDERFKESLEYTKKLQALDRQGFEQGRKDRQDLFEMDMENLDRRREEFLAMEELRKEMEAKQREFAEKQLELQEQSLGIQAAAAIEQYNYNQEMTKTDETWKNITGYMKMVNDFQRLDSTLRDLSVAMKDTAAVPDATLQNLSDFAQDLGKGQTAIGADAIADLLMAINNINTGRLQTLIQLLSELP